ncbi:MAG: MlaD family protein [Bacteroidota bacterium]|nr:MlaD family protein [Bacteroidota bacterium]
MEEQRKREIKVGITVIVGIAILLGGISYFKGLSLTKTTHMIRMRFEASGGLQENDPVTLNGVKIGAVHSVEIEGETVLVEAEIDERYTIASDAVPVIRMLELMGGKKVDIEQGKSPVPHDPHRVLPGRVDPDIAGALGMLGDLRERVDSLARKSGDFLDHTNTIVGDTALIGALRESVEHLRTASRELDAMLVRNRGNIDETAENVARLSRRGAQAVDELYPRLSSGIDKVEKLAERADSLLADVDGIVSDVRRSRGVYHSIVTDTTLARRLETITVKLDSVASIIMQGQMRIKLRL